MGTTCAYEPRTNGIAGLLSSPAMPGRDQFGRFVSGLGADVVDEHVDPWDLPDNAGVFFANVGEANTDTPSHSQECRGPERVYNDRYAALAKERNVPDEEVYWDYAALHEGPGERLVRYYRDPVDDWWRPVETFKPSPNTTFEGRMLTEEVADDLYIRRWARRSDDDGRDEDLDPPMPSHSSSHSNFDLKGLAGGYSTAFRKNGRDDDTHGRHGRLNGLRLGDHRDIRRRRQDTHRQMDYIWLEEMTGDHADWFEVYLDYHRYDGFFPIGGGFYCSDRAFLDAKRLLAANGIDEAFVDRHWSGYGDQEELWNLAEGEDELNDQHWEFFSSCGWEDDPYWYEREEDPADHDPLYDEWDEWDDWFDPPEPLTAEELEAIEREEEAAREAVLEAYVPAQFGGVRGWRARFVSN